jgi:hypothetical protein
LNGTNVGSITIVSEADGHPVYKKVSSAFAQGVTLTFFSDFACAGSQLGASSGHNSAVAGVNGAKSVKISCNGKSTGSGDALPLSVPVAIKVYEGKSFTGEAHQTDGSEGECRGLGLSANGKAQSIQFLASAKSTDALADSEAIKYGVAFYDTDGCLGKRIGEFNGNKADISSFAIKPKSVKFVPVRLLDADQTNTVKATNGASSMVFSALALVAPAIAALF